MISTSDFSEFKLLFRKHPERMGVDIDQHAVRIVRMAKDEDGNRSVVAFGELDLDLWHAGVMEQQRFRSAVGQLGSGLRRVALGIEHPSLRVRRMVFAKMPDRDLIEAIRWNFREQVEGAIEKYVVGYIPLEETAEAGKMAVMAFGITEDAVKEHVALAKSMGLKVISLEPSATALLAVFHANGILSDGRHHVCVTFGDGISQFIVMKAKTLLFSRPLPGINNDSLVKLIMRNLNIEETEAKNGLAAWIKRFESGAAAPDVAAEAPAAAGGETDETANLQRRMETTIGHFLSQLVIEVQRSIDAFCIMYGAEGVDNIHVCGMGMQYPGIAMHMTKNLGIETALFNPFDRLMKDEMKTEAVLKSAPIYAVATGLAIP